MKIRLPLTILFLFALESSAFANQPASGEAVGFLFTIVPVTSIFLVLASTDRRFQQGEKPTKKELGNSIWIALPFLLLSGAHEGFAAYLALFLVPSACSMIYRELKLWKESGGKRRIRFQAAGIMVMVYILFAGAAPFIYFGSNYYYMKDSEGRYVEILSNYYHYQESYREEHGHYNPLSLEMAREEEVDHDIIRFARWVRHYAEYFSVELDYLEDLQSYQVRLVPNKFFIPPYKYLSPRRAYYLDQTGVIRYTTMTGPGEGASGNSNILCKVNPPESMEL
jgi:hypothetical protein